MNILKLDENAQSMFFWTERPMKIARKELGLKKWGCLKSKN